MWLADHFFEHSRYLAFIGIALVIGIAYFFSRNRAAVPGRLILHALVLQLVFAWAVLKTTTGHWVMQQLADGVKSLYDAAEVGIAFLFGNLAQPSGPWGFVFAIKVLPAMIFFGALMGLLFYVGVVGRLTAFMNRLVRPLLDTSGAETLCATANSFLGQTEAPLLVRPYLATMTPSELLVVMVSGMGTMSGAIIAVYAIMGVPAIHLLTASVMAIPGTIMMAKILYPEMVAEKTADGEVKVTEIPAGSSALGALATGTSDGLSLALHVGAMLIAFIALLGFGNSLLAWLCCAINNLLCIVGAVDVVPVVTIETILGTLFAPIAWLLGFTGGEAVTAGALLGVKLVANEMVAYSQMVAAGLSERTVMLLTYALGGFANFSSIGIQIGGIGALIPERKALLAELGMYALLGGTLSNLLSAFMVALFV